MKNQFKLCLITLALLAPSLSFATSLTQVENMPKEVWLAQIKSAIPVPICKGFMEDAIIKARMRERNLNYENCLGLLPVIADKCGKKYETSLPTVLSRDDAEKWGQTLGECIGNDFSQNYLYGEPKTPTTNSVKGS